MLANLLRDFGESPAFPLDQIDPAAGHGGGRYEVVEQHRGMTLRAWLAGQALGSVATGIIAAGSGADTDVTARMLAKAAVQVADEVLAALKQ